jgi:hypothetical protein
MPQAALYAERAAIRPGDVVNPAPFFYRRALSLGEAVGMLAELPLSPPTIWAAMTPAPAVEAVG